MRLVVLVALVVELADFRCLAQIYLLGLFNFWLIQALLVAFVNRANLQQDILEEYRWDDDAEHTYTYASALGVHVVVEVRGIVSPVSCK